jgi:hypothetical protein
MQYWCRFQLVIPVNKNNMERSGAALAALAGKKVNSKNGIN